ncbi:Acyl-CoA thioester hydrolase YbgC [compost metagenome]
MAPARYDDELVVTTRLESVRTRSLVFTYRITRGEDLVAEVRTAHVCVGRDGKPTALPEAMRAQLAAGAP